MQHADETYLIRQKSERRQGHFQYKDKVGPMVHRCRLY